MFRAGVSLAGLIAIFASTRSADAYDFGATVEAMVIVKHLPEKFKKDAPEATSSWSSKDVAHCQGFSEVTAEARAVSSSGNASASWKTSSSAGRDTDSEL
jgi:hypothetical protein